MGLNQPKAKIRFKSDSNQLLIDFFNPKSLPDLIEIDATIRIWTQISNLNSIYIVFDKNLPFQSFN